MLASSLSVSIFSSSRLATTWFSRCRDYNAISIEKSSSFITTDFDTYYMTVLLLVALLSKSVIELNKWKMKVLSFICFNSAIQLLVIDKCLRTEIEWIFDFSCNMYDRWLFFGWNRVYLSILLADSQPSDLLMILLFLLRFL